MREVSQWLMIYSFFSYTLLCCVRESSVTAVFWWWVQLCHQGSFEVTALLSPLLMFTQAFWAALNVNRGSIAEWYLWASL